jgi:16S rRNA (cytosine967-C5)-methyltransferase
LDRVGGYAQLPARDRAFARALAATVLRRLGQIDAVIAACLAKPLTPKARAVETILRLGVVQLLFLGTPPHAAVDETVGLTEGRLRPYTGLVNAVLRRVVREGRDLLGGQDEARLNTPDWLWESWAAAYGEERARAIAAAHLKEAALDLTAKHDTGAWADRLKAELLPTGSLRYRGDAAVTELPGYAEGAWWAQDAAAALPARFLGDLRGQMVIDLCAAPGGKTAQLVAAGARVLAVDRSAGRMARLEANLQRLGLPAESIVADAQTWRPAAPADAVLLDAPCSGTGTIRRRPDLPRLKTATDVARLTVLQDRLLDAARDSLRPGGRLLYCVCSLQPEEGPQRIEALLARHVDLRRQPLLPAEFRGAAEFMTPEGDLRTLPSAWPDRGGLDGFFAALLVRAG